MVDLRKISFVKLNGTNYQVKYQMVLPLLNEDLWEIISEEKPVPVSRERLKRDDKAKAATGLLVKDSQVVHKQNVKTAKKVRENLTKYYEKSTLTSKVFLLKKLCSLAENGNIEEHLTSMLD